MKAVVVLAAAASAALVNAQPHGHQHFHQKRATVTTVSDPTETAYAYELDGSIVSQEQVCAGIADGSLVWEGSQPEGACASASSIAAASSTTTATADAEEATSSSSAPATTSASAAEFYQESSSTSSTPASSSSVASYSSSSAASSPTASTTTTTSSASGSWGNFTSSAASSSYPDFPDGEISCSDGPPLEYGAIYIDYLGLEGWSGIQQIDDDGNLLGTGTSCVSGTSCSYACAPSWQKYQWLSDQPSDGASIGGLLCKDGLLYKANDNDQLCSQGNGDVYLKNSAGDGVSLCRTDYPGTESETVPLYIAAGSTEPVTCPIESEYYEHEGDLTSAEYYLNPVGVDPSVACTWDGNGDGATGNWAPIVLGVGSTDGVSWLSIQENTPTSYAEFSGTVEIVGDDCSGTCKYSNGEFCLNGEDCEANTSDGAGCTVSCTGTATFVISS